jgi:hypothetical protein
MACSGTALLCFVRQHTVLHLVVSVYCLFNIYINCTAGCLSPRIGPDGVLSAWELAHGRTPKLGSLRMVEKHAQTFILLVEFEPTNVIPFIQDS